jgi:adenine-specific DNA methylase
VLDPACGSGSFLIKAFDVFYEHFFKKTKEYQALLDFKTRVIFKREVQILLNNIFGVDLDKQAVEITRLNLLLRIAEKGYSLPELKKNIKSGNSLTDDEKVAGEKAFQWNEQFERVMKEGGFSIVIGNPPYIDSEEMVRTQPELRKAYSNIYSTAKGNWDIFCLFLEKGLELLRDGGFLGMIVPNKLLSADYATEIRRVIQNYKIVAIRDYSRIPVFQASVYPIVIVVKKETPKRNKFSAELMESYVGGVKVSSSREIEQQKDLPILQNTWAHIFGESGRKVMDRILVNSEVLENVGEISGAASVSEAYELKSIVRELSNQSSYFKFINTGTIDRYSSLWSVFKTAYIKTSYYKPVVSKEALRTFSDHRYQQAQEPKIIIAGMTKRLECYLDEGGQYLAGKSTTIMLPRKIDPKVLLAILNSKLMTFVYKNLFKSLSLAGGFMRVGPPQIRKLPIRTVTDIQKQVLTKLVDKIISLNDRLNEIYDKRTDEHARIEDEIKNVDAEIDELIFKNYGITETEKKIIENALT